MKRTLTGFAAILLIFFFSITVAAAQVSSNGPFRKTLRLRSQGHEVALLQSVFIQLPFVNFQRSENLGFFDGETKGAVKKFQKQYGLKSTGIINRKTRVILNEVVSRMQLPAVNFLLPPPPVPVAVGPGGVFTAAPPFSPLPLSPQIIPQNIAQPLPAPQAFSNSPPPPSNFIETAIEIKFESLPPAPLPSLTTPYSSYSWKTSQDVFGEETLPTPAPKPFILLDGKRALTLENSAAVRLAQLYNIYLIDTEEKWGVSEAGMMYEMLRRLEGVAYFGGGSSNSWQITLTKKSLPNDIEITAFHTARISKAAFERANPIIIPEESASPDRIFYSNRLFQAVLRIFFVDRSAIENLILQRFGVKPDFGEPRDEYQEFSIDELHYIASVFEDFPSSFHKLAGLKKIVRKKNGLKLEVCGDAAAFAVVVTGGDGYIEFSEKAFLKKSAVDIQLIIAHEMGHFVWGNILSQTTKDQFMALSGWTPKWDPTLRLAKEVVVTDHPKAKRSVPLPFDWYVASSTTFVSAYAGSLSPEEDFAETLAYYIYSPDLVRRLVPLKYDFMKNVVDGYEYVLLIDKKYTFEVFNLNPDYRFPGQIVGVDIDVYKLENGNNRVVTTLELSRHTKRGATSASATITSRVKSHGYLQFRPIDGEGFLLRGETVLSKYAASGYWFPKQIIINADVAGFPRMQHISQFGWLLFLNNPEEDIEAPQPDVDNIKSEIVEVDGDPYVRVVVPVREAHEEKISANASLHQYESQQQVFENTPLYDAPNKSFIFGYPVRQYHASGKWTFRSIYTKDIAGNEGSFDLKDKAIEHLIATKRPDLQKPELDVSSIKIEATPANPTRPDGATDVKISFMARDNIAGINNATAMLLNPLGQNWSYGDVNANASKPYFVGDPHAWKSYTIDIHLPRGSPPGTWAMRELNIVDKAGNFLNTNFAEVGIVRPFKVY